MKTLLFLTTVMLTVFSLTTKAQSPTIKLDWAVSSGGATGNDNASSVAYDASGNVYTAGSFRGTVDFDPSVSTFTLASNGGADAFIQKLDANGNFLAAYKIGAASDDVISGIHVDASGNIYIAGYYSNSIDIDLGAGISALNSGTIQSCFVVKYTSTFGLTWAKSITGASTQFISSLNVDANGNVYTGGTIAAGTIDFDPNAGVSNFTVTTSAIFLHKLSSTGTLVWAKGFNSTSGGSVVRSIDFDSNQNPVFVGSFAGTIDFDASAATNTLSTTGGSGDYDAFMCKYDAAGNHLFAFRIGFSTSLTSIDIFRKVAIDNSNNIYVSGDFSGTTDFDPSAGAATQTLVGSSSTFVDGFVAKYSNTGGFLWVNTSLGNTGNYDYGNGLSVNATGDVFVATTNDIGATTSIAIHKLNSAGTLSYSRLIVTNGYCNDIQNTTTALLVAGNHVNTSEFDPSQYFTNNLTSNGASDAFVAKYSECGTQAPAVITGATALCNGSTNTYSVAANAQLEGYVWSGSILSGTSTSTTNVASLTSGQTAATGVITLTGYNHCGNTTQTLQVTVTPNTTVNVASSTSSVCAGNSVTLTASGTTSYSWASGETTASIVKNPTSTTVYTVTGYNGNCSNTKTLSINAVALPNIIVSVSQATAGCAGSPRYFTATGATSYTWNTGANTNTLTVTPTVTTVYTVTGTNVSGCVNTSTVGSQVNNPNLVVTASAYSVCPGGVSTLSVSGAQSYTWNGPGGTTNGQIRTVSPTSTSTYVVGGTGFTGCVSSTNIVVYVTAGITVSATASSTVSCSGAPVLITASGASTYAWVGTGVTTNTISVTPSTPTTYTVNGTSGTCSGTKTITIGVATSPNVNATTSTPIICAGMSANLVASVSPVVPTMSYTWSTSQTTSNISVTPTITTTYTVIGRNFANGCTDNASITLSVSPQITVSVTTNSTVSCSGSPVILSASGASTYTWNTGSNSNTVSVSPTSNTTYSITGASGACSNSQTISVNAATNPSLSATTNNTLLCSSQSALLTANGAGVVSYLWNTGAVSPNISVTPTTTTVYSVTGTDALGCSTTIAITQSVSTCTGLNETENTTTLFSVYPNPNSGEFTMATTKGVYNIINTIGAVVKTIEVENDAEVIDVKDLPQGIYYIIGKTSKAKIIITK